MRSQSVCAICVVMTSQSLIIALFLLAGPAWAQPASGTDLPALAAATAKRFPQPVRVGDLLGQDVIAPIEAQPVLGHVASITRRPDGGLSMVIRYGGAFGLFGRAIAVPIEAVALVGPSVTIKGFTPDQLDRFPTIGFPAPAALGPNETISVGLVRPFH